MNPPVRWVMRSEVIYLSHMHSGAPVATAQKRVLQYWDPGAGQYVDAPEVYED